MYKLSSVFEHLKDLKILMVIVGAVIGFALYAMPAFAGVGLGVSPSFPTNVTVGDNNVPVSMAITNNSDGGDGILVDLTSITLIPSCGASSGSSCTSVDPGVFSIDSSGTGAGACAGRTFSIAETDATSGKVTFTPDLTISLGLGATCTINFTADVIGSPDIDSNGVTAGMQTKQIGEVAAIEQDGTGLDGGGFGTDTTTVAKVSPSISTTPNPSSGTVGDMLNDTATLSGGFSPTGSVTFKLYPPADSTCAGAASYTDVDATAPYATSPGFLSNAAGVWHWTADYAGDANNNATSSGCTAEPVTVAAAKGHIIVDKITNPSGSSQSFSFTTSGTGYNGFSLTDAASPNNQEVDAGSYTVAEGSVSGWSSDGGVCDNGETPDSLDVGAGETITCTFTNTLQNGTLIVQKTTLPGATTTSFAINATGSGTITGGGAGTITDANDESYSVTPGTYSVSETLPANWEQTSNTCTNVEVAAGETETCVITNTYVPPATEWCSPGYWRNHLDSWVGFDTDDLFLASYPGFTFPTAKKNAKFTPNANPTLLEILQSPQIYGGEAFNLVGDLLSDANPELDFDIGDARVENCPLN